MAGEVKVEATIEGNTNLSDVLDELYRKRIRHAPGACRRCIKNEDPDKAGKIHKHCRCDWYWERVQ